MAKGARRWTTLVTLVLLAAAVPLAVQAQTSLQGQVIAADGQAGIPQVAVELVGVGTRLTSDTGYFRFDDVEPGGYLLRVSALGWAPDVRAVRVDGETTVTVEMDIQPIELAPLGVEVRLVDLDGKVLDRTGSREVVVVDATVRSDRVPGTYTDSHGRFEIEDVPEGAPIHIQVQAFGYLQLDTIVEASGDEDYVFGLEVDEATQRLIDVQVRRLEERRNGFGAVVPAMDRDELLLYAGSATLWDVLVMRYRPRLARTVCSVVDEVEIPRASQFVAIAKQLLPEQVERIEFMTGGANTPDDSDFSAVPGNRSGPGSGHLPPYQIRIYTRRFMQEMIAGNPELRTPSFMGRAGSLCQ